METHREEVIPAHVGEEPASGGFAGHLEADAFALDAHRDLADLFDVSQIDDIVENNLDVRPQVLLLGL